MAVILTSQLNKSAGIPGLNNPRSGAPMTEAEVAIASQHGAQLPVPPSLIERGLEFVASSFATTFWVGFVLVLCTFIPIAFRPRQRQPAQLDKPTGEGDGVIEAPVMIH